VNEGQRVKFQCREALHGVVEIFPSAVDNSTVFIRVALRWEVAENRDQILIILNWTDMIFSVGPKGITSYPTNLVLRFRSLVTTGV